ncbi:MAG: cytochrome P450 [Acidobacteria bacterium]|nr:cytochrome P450 [Acidobacteriota bacterium]
MTENVNLLDADLFPRGSGPPHALFDAWRENDPLHWNPPNPDYPPPGVALPTRGFYVLTRYKDVSDVSRNQRVFSSHPGGPLIWDWEGEPLRRQQAGIMGMPLEEHRAVRRVVVPPFTRGELLAFQPEIDAVAKEIVDDVAGLGECEFVFDVASKLPVYTFCSLTGVPARQRDTVAQLGNMNADVENWGSPEEGSLTAELFEIAMRIAAEKRANPDDTLMSRLTNSEVDGERLDPMTLSMFFVTISIAGHETTRGTAGHFIRLMNEHPDQYDLLRSDPDRYLPNAIEEVLRYAPPVVKFRRTVTEEVELHGTTLDVGDKIYLSYPAANRDPEMFPDPNQFDITRENAARHLAFGVGPRACIGARLARMQLFSLLKEIVTRIPDIRHGEIERMRSIWFDAIVRMPVTYTAEDSRLSNRGPS